MDQILAIPQDRPRHNVPLLCALMGVTALLMLTYVNQPDPRARLAAQAGAAEFMVADIVTARPGTPRLP